jgi:hypothetical protein
VLSFRASSFDTYPRCARKFGAEWLVSSGEARALRYDFHPRRPHIGAVVGTGFHTGTGYLMKEWQVTGEHGGRQRLEHAQDMAAVNVQEQMTGTQAVTMDDTTKSGWQAQQSAKAMVGRIHDELRPTSAPLIVEKGMKAEYPGGFQVTGTLDLFMIAEELNDHKSWSRFKPKSVAQPGTYSILLRSNGHEVQDIALNAVQRRKDGAGPLERINIDRDIAELHAMNVAKRAAADVQRMIDTGDPEELIANPSDPLCSDKWCCAWNSPFCRIGALVNGGKS